MARVKLCDRLTVSYGDKLVLKDFSLSVPDRGITLLRGPPAAARPPCSGPWRDWPP